MSRNKPKGMQTEARIPLEWHVPDELVSHFATHMVVQTIENAVKLSFFEAKPQIRLEPTSPIPRAVRADCVASIIISPEKLLGIIEALQKHLSKGATLKKHIKPEK